MSMYGFINWTLIGLCIVLIVNAVGAEDKDDQLLDSLTADDTLKTKRPFCNAFTGCGKKRSYNDNSVEHENPSEMITIRLPIFLYRALIRIATREIRDAIERTSRIEYSPSIDSSDDYSSYLPIRKIPIRKRYES